MNLAIQIKKVWCMLEKFKINWSRKDLTLYTKGPNSTPCELYIIFTEFIREYI